MKRTIKEIAGISAMFIFFLSLAIACVILFTPLYSWVAQRLSIAEGLGMSHAQLMENYYSLLRYLNLPWLHDLSMPDFTSSASGILHFFEVKRLFIFDYVILILSAFGSFHFFKHIRVNKRGYILKRPITIAAIAPVLLTFLLATNFDWLFTTFHQLLFNNDAWLFNPETDPIILALPEEFFMVCFVVVFLLFELFLVFAYQFAKRHSYL